MNVHREHTGFTLVELLVVIAVIAVLAVVVILTLNPTQLIKQSRDANRVSDMTTLNKAISLYYEDAINQPSTLFMGTSSIIYLSVPDPTATSSAGTNCAGLGLGLPATGYHCPASSTYRNTNGTGWIPIDFASSTIGSSIASLSVDPINTTSSGEYYEYETDGAGNWQIVSAPESQKYLSFNGSFSGGTTSTLLGALDVTFSTSTYGIVASTSPSVYGIAFDSHTDNVLVADGNADAITTLNDTTYATSSYPIPTTAYNIAFDPHTNTIWITSDIGGGTVTTLNDTTYAVVNSYTDAGTPLGIAFDPHTNTMWVTNGGLGTVTAINDITYAASSYAVGSLYPNAIAFDSNTNTMWVTNGASNSVTAINDTTYATSSYAVGATPYGIAFDSHTNTIWVANSGSNTVTAINGTTYATSTYAVSTALGQNIAFDPHTDSIWVGGTTGSGVVTAINDITYATSSYSGFISPFGMVFDSNTNALWMSSIAQDWVTQFTPSY